MPSSNTNLEQQVNSCRSLLAVFHQERQFYQESEQVTMEAVVRILQAKEKLVQVFSDQKSVLAETSQLPKTGDSQRQQLLRELGVLLEQLLVIDRENELLLRKLLGPNSAPPPTPLRRQSVAPAAPTAPTPKPDNAMPRSRIRCYQKYSGKSASQRESHASYV